jgi:hypothetical protein
VGAAERVVRRLSSVLCSVDIVKRVVTVKQVRPSLSSSLRWGEVGPGAWVCVPMREHRRGCRVRSGPEGQVTETGEQKRGRDLRHLDLSSDLCPLISARARFWGYRPAGYLSPKRVLGAGRGRST